MLRTTAARPFLKGFVNVKLTKSSYDAAASASRLGSNAQFHSLSTKRPTAIAVRPVRSVTVSILRYATGPSKNNPLDTIDKSAEKKVGAQEIEAHPDLVSGGSSVRHVFESSPGAAEKDADMMAGIKADIVSLVLQSTIVTLQLMLLLRKL